MTSRRCWDGGTFRRTSRVKYGFSPQYFAFAVNTICELTSMLSATYGPLPAVCWFRYPDALSFALAFGLSSAPCARSTFELRMLVGSDATIAGIAGFGTDDTSSTVYLSGAVIVTLFMRYELAAS